MKFLLLVFLLPLKLFSQDISGVWTGTLYNDTTKQFLRYELAISGSNGEFSGYSHTIFVIDGKENIGVKSVKIKKSGDQFFIEDDKLIYNNYTEPPAKGVKTFSELALTEDDSSMTLSGAWKTNHTRIYKSITGQIFLKKKKEIQETLIIQKLENLGLAKSLSFIAYGNYSTTSSITNKQAVNRQLAETTDVTVSDNKSVDEKTKSAEKNEEPQTKKEFPDKSLNKTHLPSLVNQSLKDQIVIKKATLNIKADSGLVIKDEKVLNRVSPIAGTTPVTNRTSKVSAIDMGITHLEMKEARGKLPTSTLVYHNNNLTPTDIHLVPMPAADISSRKIETIKSVDIKNDSLTLTLYDNGEVDGDTVSILLNGKVIMPMQGLSTRAINKTIYLTPEMGDSIVLIMYAENLGSIPPNTGLLVVHDGDAVYEIFFSGDLHENAAIILKRKKRT
jgi:hypothetical protein